MEGLYRIAVAVTLVLGCRPDPTIEVEVEPYEGTAYPNRVAPIAYPTGPAALVTDSYSDSISVIDLTTGDRIDHRVVGRNPVDLDGPHHIAVDEVGGFAYIGLSYPVSSAIGPHASHGSASAPGYIQKLSLVDMSILGQVRVDANPGDILLSADGKRVVTSHFDLLRATNNPTDLEKARATVAVADAASIEMSGSPSPKLIKTCVAPHGMVMIDPSGSPLFVSCYGEDKIAMVDLDTETVDYVDVGPNVSGFGSPIYGPYVLTLLPDGHTLVVSNTASKDVRFFDADTKAMDLDRTVPLLGAPYFPALSLDGAHLVVPTQQPDALVVIDLEGQDETTTRNLTDEECVLPHVIATLTDGYALVCEGDKKSPGKVVMLDADLEVVTSTEVGVYPDGIVPLGGSK